MMNGGACDVELAGQRGLTTRPLNGSVSRLTRQIGEIVHARTVEKSSTVRKPFSRDLLYMLAERISACSGPMSESQHKQDIGARLRIVREALGYGLREFARKHGIDPTKLSHWEKGRHYPDPAFIRLLWDAHNVTADWVYLDRKAGLPRELADSLDGVLAAYAAARPAEAHQADANADDTKPGSPSKSHSRKREHS